MEKYKYHKFGKNMPEMHVCVLLTFLFTSPYTVLRNVDKNGHNVMLTITAGHLNTGEGSLRFDLTGNFVRFIEI